jgi:hypothetical protein
MALRSASGVEAFRARFAGEVLVPGDPAYDDARSVWNGDIDRYPAMIARCSTADEVAAAIEFGRQENLEISVRGGGHSFAGFSVCDGSAEEHERVVKPIRQALAPLFELVTPMPHTELQKMFDKAYPWGILAYEKALNLDELNDEAIAVFTEHVPRMSSPLSFVPMFPLGGAYSRVGDDETAFGGSRTPCFSLTIAAASPSPEVLEADRAWVRSFWEALRPHASGSGSYVNFMAEHDDARVRASYGTSKYERLARIKAAYDPDNVFHLNANIKPAPLPA